MTPHDVSVLRMHIVGVPTGIARALRALVLRDRCAVARRTPVAAVKGRFLEEHCGELRHDLRGDPRFAGQTNKVWRQRREKCV
jgi:hypothetical protein